MRGRWLSQSIPRRIVADIMFFSARVPSIPMQRQLRLQDVVAARDALPERPPWSALFTKAYALVAAEYPELRRAYLQLPWPHFYEYRASVAAIAIEREFAGEMAVFILTVKDPANLPLAEIGRIVRNATQAPVESIPQFLWTVRIARMPLLLRRLLGWLALNIPRARANRIGTFALTTVSALGAEIVHPRAAHATLLTYGVLGEGGAVTARVIFDHRVLDAATVARALTRLQEVMDGPILAELRTGEPN